MTSLRALHNKLRMANTRAAVLQNSLDALARAIVLCDQNGKIIFLNAAAEHLIGRCPELVMRGDKLCATCYADTLKLEKLTKKVTGADGKQPFGGAVTIKRGVGKQPLQVAATPVPLENRAMLMTGMGSLAMLVIHDPSEQTFLPEEIVSSLFGLTPSETHLLLALSNGQTLKQFGDRTGVTQNTARTHLKSLFAKTRTSRQSDLIRLMSGLMHSMAFSDR